MRPLFRESLIVAGIALVAAQAEATTVYLTQSNEDLALPDGTNYLRVDVDDIGSDVRITVSILQPLLDLAGSNFGIQNVTFNIAGSVSVSDTGNILGTQAGGPLPSGWSANVAPPPNQGDGFGRFDVEVSNGGTNRQSPSLVFYIIGVSGDSAATYTSELSLNNNGQVPAQGSALFTVRVAGFNGPNGVTSAYFGGSAIAVVPLPAAGWLLLSGLGLLGWRMRRT